MAGFRYNNKSTEDIIDVPLILVAFDTIDSLGSTRSKIEGDITISRPITNEYGTLYDPLSFTYSLIKSDFTPFTTEEQVIVERWLTSPKLSSELTIINCDEKEYNYFGLFTNTVWEIGNGGLAICTFTFQVNGAYAYKYYTVTDTAAHFDEENNITSFDDTFWMEVECPSDELEEYVYPIIKVSGYNNENCSFTLKNTNDSNKFVTVTTDYYEALYLDCQHCIVGEYHDGSYYSKTNYVKYKELGWDDITDLYWPRLVPGTNNLTITGHVKVEISFYVPFKKVGGWLT